MCDVDESLLQRRTREIEAAGRRKPAAFTDYRKPLEDGSIDAVSIATPRLIGDPYQARAIVYKWRGPTGRAQTEPVPAGVHYNL